MDLGGGEPDQKQQVVQLLLKKVARAFYSPYHVVVLDAFLWLAQQSHNGKVRESDIVDRVKLSKAQVSVMMKRFRADQLVEDDVVAEAEKEEDFFGKAIKGREKKVRPGYNRTRKLDEFWQLNIEHLLKAIRYRHSQILEKLNKYSDSNEQTFVCMNPKCEGKGQPISIYDVLMYRDPNDPEFRCKYCFIEKDGKLIYIPLKQSSETAAQAQGKFQWKKEFIQLTSSIMEQVQTLEFILKKEKDALALEARDKAEPDEKIGMGGESRRSQEEKLRAEGIDHKRGLADLGANEDKVVVKVDRRNTVDLNAKKQKIGPSIPLPWDQTLSQAARLSVPAVPLLAPSVSVEPEPELDELARKQQEDEKHQQELSRVLELQRSSSLHGDEDEDEPDVTLSVGGIQMTCKLRDIDQDQVDQMTPAEIGIYEELIRRHQREY